MGRYGIVKSDMYEDRAFKELSMQGRLLYVYLLTCPYCNYIGYFYIDIDKVALDTEIPADVVEKELTAKRKKPLWLYDEAESQVLILNYLKHNKLKSKTQINGIRRQIETLSASPLLAQFMNQVRLYVNEDISSIFGEDTERKLRKMGTG